jgi:hypothetical protein
MHLICLFIAAYLPAVETVPALALSIPDASVARQRLLTDAMARWGAGALAPGWDTVATARGFRFRVDVRGWSAGLPDWTWSAAWRIPAGADPTDPRLRIVRDGGWLHAAAGGRAPFAAELQSDHDGREDVRLALDLPALAGVLPPARAEAARAVAAVWRAATASARVGLGPDGLEEVLRIPGAETGLAPIDPAALAGIPADAAWVVAWGQRGGALAPVVPGLLALAGVEGAAAALAERCGRSPAEVLAAVEGTVALAVLADGTWVVSLPGGAAVAGLLADLHAGQAGAAGLDHATDQPVAMDLPGLGPVMVRAAAGRWLLGSDPGLLNTLAADAPPPWQRPWPGDGRPVVVAALAPASVAAACAALSGHLSGLAAGWQAPAMALAVHQDADGLRIESRRGPATLLAGAVLAGGDRLPAFAAAEAAAQRALAEARLREVLALGQARARQLDGVWPRDLADLLRGAPFAAPGRTDIAVPWLYVRPDEVADARPVLVQDPACHGGAGSLVGFRDGRTAFVPGRTAWEAAQRVLAGRGTEDL